MRKYYIILMILAAVALLDGCGIYTNYERPGTLPVDRLYRGQTAADTTSIAGLPWRELFADKPLAGYIEQALRQNTDLQTARLLTEEAKATLQAARLAFLPSLALESQGQLSSYAGSAVAKTYTIGAAAEWEIDAFGSLRNDHKSKLAAYHAQKAYEQAVQTQLVATVADTYYSLVATDRKLQLTLLSVEAWRENLRTMKALKKAGQQTEAAVSRSEASLAETETTVLSLKRQANELENTMSLLLGMSPQEIIRTDMPDWSSMRNVAVGVPIQMLSRRPDVRQAEWQLAEAFYVTNGARSAFYPHITLGGTAGWTNSGGAVIENPGKWLLNAVGSLTQPLFNRGKNMANLKIAKARQQEALLAFSQKILDAGAQVNNALVQLQTAHSSMALDAERVTALDKAVDSTTKLMKHGDANYLEVITAQQSLLQAQMAEVDDRYVATQAIITLYHALGGGCE
ncbi:MAG: efflux transporter outer membrane subunit [Prevotella sp.]